MPINLGQAFLLYKNQKGQVLLIVVLVMIVVLTVGLSVASRSITNLRTSTEEINSQKALSAAEAGIEQALQTNTSIANGSFSNNTIYNTNVTEVLGTSFLLNGGNTIPKDDGVDLWLSLYSTDPARLYQNPWSGNLTIYWGDSTGSCNNAALELTVISGTKSSPGLNKYAFDPCQARANGNHFSLASSVGANIDIKSFSYSAAINNIASGLIIRVAPLYAGTSIGVIGSQALPSQGFLIKSTGSSGSTQRKVNVYKGYPQLPSQYFSYGLFSP